MKREGIIVDQDKDYAKVLVTRQQACGDNCASCSGCDDTEILKIKKDISVDIGEKVYITAEGSSLLSYILLLYGVPLVMLIAGIFISYSYFTMKNIESVEIYSFFVGIIAFVASAFFIKRLDNRFKEKEEFLKLEKM